MAWKNAPAIESLKAAVLSAYTPAVRKSTYVGTVGDAAHAARKSDHNPNGRGYVCAIDVGFEDETQDDLFVQALVRAKDPRLSYIISDGKMWRSYAKPGIPAWTAAKYSGPNPHKRHVHVSVSQDPRLYMDAARWSVTPAPAPDRLVLKTGSTGARVRLLQDGLRRVFPAYAGSLAIDGDYGPATERAVREFQRRSALTVDGIVGPATAAALSRMGVRL